MERSCTHGHMHWDGVLRSVEVDLDAVLASRDFFVIDLRHHL